MNVNDIMPEQLTIINFAQCVSRQKELIELYKDFDKDIIDINLQTYQGQKKIKALLWRIVEELGEAYECIEQNDKTHFKEELIDFYDFYNPC